MKKGYSDDKVIERINNDGDYCKVNCKWVSMKEQSRNKRNNRTITYKGETLTVAGWEERTGIKKNTIITRLNSPNFTDEQVFETPIGTTKISHRNCLNKQTLKEELEKLQVMIGQLVYANESEKVDKWIKQILKALQALKDKLL